MSCTKRGDAASCSYSNNNRNGTEKRATRSRDSEVQLRLQKLENMVTGLMRTSSEGTESRSDKPLPFDVAVDHCLQDLSIESPLQTSKSSLKGHLDVNGSETNYLGATHWATILENVRL